MRREVKRKQYFKIGPELTEKVQSFFLKTGHSDVTIAKIFSLDLAMVNRITRKALINYKNERININS